jgi:uncharacterized membrane protein YbhN (UPF0104 family)
MPSRRRSSGDTDLLHVDGRNVAKALGIATLLGVVAIGVIGAVTDSGKMLDAVRRAAPAWFAVAALGQVFAYAGYILAYRSVSRARGGPCLDYWSAGRAVAVGFGAFVLGSSAGGLAVDFWVLHRAGESVHQATRRVLALNTLQWLVLGTLATASAALVLAGLGAAAPVEVSVAWLVIVPAATIAGAWFSRDEQVERFGNVDVDGPSKRAKGARAWGARVWAKAVGLFGDAIGGVGLVRYMVLRPLRHPGGIAGFTLYWVGDMFTLYAALRAFDVHLDPAALVLAYATGYVIVVLPLPAGAGGAAELAMAFALHLVGVPLGTAILAAFAYRFYTVWLPIVPALLFLPAVRGLAEDLQHTPRPAHASGGR